MAKREDIKRIVAQLRDAPPFWDYVKTLEAQRDVCISQLLVEIDPAKVESKRGEARAYDELIKQIHQAIKDLAT